MRVVVRKTVYRCDNYPGCDSTISPRDKERMETWVRIFVPGRSEMMLACSYPCHRAVAGKIEQGLLRHPVVIYDQG